MGGDIEEDNELYDFVCAYGFSGDAEYEIELIDCPICKGTGKELLFQFFHDCQKCNATGKIEK